MGFVYRLVMGELSRAELLAKIAKHGPRAIEVLAAASDKGDVNAAKLILAKLLPDLRSVDVTQLEASQARIVVNPTIYIRADAGKKAIKLPNININISEPKAVPPASEPVMLQEIDITPQLKASPVPVDNVESVNYKQRRMKGRFE